MLNDGRLFVRAETARGEPTHACLGDGFLLARLGRGRGGGNSWGGGRRGGRFGHVGWLCGRQGRSRVVAPLAGDRVLELPHSLAELPAHFGQPLGAENKQQHEQQDQKFPDSDSERHGRENSTRVPTVMGKIRGPGTIRTGAACGFPAAGSRPFRTNANGDQLALLEIKNLHVALEDGTPIVKGVDLAVDTNEKHAIMGPNGSGKSTLAYALMGHPAYEITEGEVLLDGQDVAELGADERAQHGLFLAFQYPHAIPGVTVTSFLRSAINAKRKAANGGEDDPIAVKEFRTELLAAMEHLKVPRELAQRYLNDGFSGGEKKRVEILQMAMLKPRIAVLDETDSGLDIDALRVVANGVNELVGPEMGALVITHYQRILNYITPDHVHVFVDGRIVASGGAELAQKLEAEGYEAFIPAGIGSES
jgi:Fe-S cluster assembly ATP-binding protein